MNKTYECVSPFLVHEEPPKGTQLVFNQVELRDYFAAAALQPLVTSAIELDHSKWDAAVQHAYLIADAMIKAREAKP